MEKKDRNIEAVAKLISLTRDGKIEWQSTGPSKLADRYPVDEKVDSVFTADFNDKQIRIFRHLYKDKMYSSSQRFLSLYSLKDSNANVGWVSEVVLELYDAATGNQLWEFPKEQINRDLLKTIKYRVSGAADFIESLLNE